MVYIVDCRSMHVLLDCSRVMNDLLDCSRVMNIYSTSMSCNFYDWFKIYYYVTFQSFYILIDKYFCIYADGTEDQGI